MSLESYIVWDWDEGDTPAEIASLRNCTLKEIYAVLEEAGWPNLKPDSVSPVYLERRARRDLLASLSVPALCEEITLEEVREIFKEKTPEARRLQWKIIGAVEDSGGQLHHRQRIADLYYGR